MYFPSMSQDVYLLWCTSIQLHPSLCHVPFAFQKKVMDTFKWNEYIHLCKRPISIISKQINDCASKNRTLSKDTDSIM